MRRVLLLLGAVLPSFLKLAVYRHLLGWKIGRRVRIGFSYIDAADAIFGDGVSIGHFNIMRGIQRLHIGSGTYIANFNQFFGTGNHYRGFAAELSLGESVNFMSRHFIDVAGTVRIGSGTTVGGRDTQFWSHTLAMVDGRQALVPTCVHIGDGVYVGARATLVSCAIPDGAVIGAGSVVTKDFPAEATKLLIAGNPATVLKRYVDG